MDINENVRKLEVSNYIHVEMPSKIVPKISLIQYRYIVKTIGKKWGILKSELQKKG